MDNEIWNKVLTTIKPDINKQSFEMWLKDTKPLSISENTINIEVPDEVAKRHISDNYSSIIRSALKETTGRNLSCQFVSNNNSHSSADNIEQTLDRNIEIKNNAEYTSSMLYPQYTFNNFVVGPNNQLAHAAAVSVSRSPASQYNPLFIYGETGLGKTHLLQAIAHSILNIKSYLRILYLPFEQFINEFIQAIRTNTITSFKINYRNVDVLLIDDIQFIEKKEQTQEEFFHTFNTLYNNKKQIVISSDRPPKELSTLEERLRTRFEWGLITDIQAPNLETREAILRNKAEKEGIDIPDEVLNYIARRIKSNIRALEAALTRLNMVSALSNDPINIHHAKTHLRQLFDDDSDKKITIPTIMAKVSEKMNITIDDLKSKSRHSRIVLPRFVAIYLSRRLTNLTTTEIGKEFGDRDHSTIINAMNNIEKIKEEDEDIKEIIEDMISELKC
ncbi:MAG: chromosomal replication initiator protein DnaA [Spirochaetota bacterium]|nr:chromosomal replication initiator protein DnaA [Spirochaetota bacterium]